VLGRWGGAAAPAEELVVCRRSPEQIEVHCHGGTAAVSGVIKRLIDGGCHQISWQDWLLKRCGDPIQAAAHIALANAPTTRTAGILLDQYHGALSQAINMAIDASRSENWSRAADCLDTMLAYRDVGLHLVTPWRVVLAGATNVGKSSLINALAGFQRSIVSHHPGTTRDVVTLETAIDGWPVQLADTAGLRATSDELESAGVELAVASLEHADLVLAIADAAQPQDETHRRDQVLGLLSRSSCVAGVIEVRNKADLLTPTDRAAVLRNAGAAEASLGTRLRGRASAVLTSAVTGEGIAELVSAIGQALVPVAPPAGSAVPFIVKQVTALEAARAAIDASDARTAVAALESLLATEGGY
jgi:tRNA modification GTPase